MLCIQVISERRFRRRLTECREEITVCGQKAYKVRGISTPLLFRSSGFTLDIYIPEEIIEQEKLVAHAVLHENVHKKHGDIWWGYLRNLLVAAYWFHPLVWVAAFCSKRDCEYACDSSVTGQMDQEERISYGNSLLSLVQLGREGNLFHVATLMSIRKSELKKRIYLVKRGKRNGIAATVVTALVIAAVSVSTFTGVKAEANPERESQLQGEISETGGQQQEEAKEEPTEAAISAGKKEAVGAETEEAAEQTVPDLEKESSELTMEKLLDSYHNEELSKWTIKKILKYENISEILLPEKFEEKRDFEGILSYEGIDYRLFVSYYKGKLEDMRLENKETGEDKIFYVSADADGYESTLVSLDDFLHHDNILDEEISYTLPEKLLETKDSYNVGGGKIGRLFCRDEKEKHGLYSVRTGGLLRFWWNSTGGLMKSYNLVYNKEDKMVDLFKNEHTNNSTREFSGGKLQRIDGCENVTSLQGLVFNPDAEWEFGAPNWYSQKEAGDLTKKEAVEALSGRKFWVICVLDEKNIEEWQSLGYIFFFDAERYSKKQMIALAKSVHLK